MINSPIKEKEEAKTKPVRPEKRMLDSSKVKELAIMNSSSDLGTEGFTSAVAEANEKMQTKNKKGQSQGLFGCFICCGPKNSQSAQSTRKRPMIRSDKRKQLITSPTTTDLEEE